MMNWRTTKPKARLQIEKRVGETDLHGLSHPCRLTARLQLSRPREPSLMELPSEGFHLFLQSQLLSLEFL
jgi:hypothetical protein